MFDFYESILNINKYDKEKVTSTISSIINREKNAVFAYTDNLEGLCKILCNNIKLDLDNINLRTNLINIHNLNNHLNDHIFLITSFKDKNNIINYILIDPTYTQFEKREKEKVLGFKDWPASVLKNTDIDLFNKLINNGFAFIDDNKLQNYLHSFDNDINITLDDIVLKKYKEDTYEDNKRNYS